MIALDKKDRDFIKKTLRQYAPNAKYWVFGSRIKGAHKKHSDLDIAIIGQDKLPLNDMFTINEAFAQSGLTFMVDVIDFHQISAEFKDHIQKEYEEL